MKKIIVLSLCLSTAVKLFSQTYTPPQGDSFFKSGNWKETVKAYTWLIDNGKAPRPGIAWYRIAVANYSLNDFNGAIPAFKKAISYNSSSAWMYNLACTFNRAGIKDSCYTWLQMAVEKGYTQYDDIIKDDDLASLRNEEKYKTILQKVKGLTYPCSVSPEYRQFDFWIGEWNVTDIKTGNPAGKSTIELLLGECVIMENWQPVSGAAGKSFNIYNITEKKWRQTYVDASGSLLEFYDGDYRDSKMQFKMKPGIDNTMHRLSFIKINDKEVRQLGEISKDNGANWQSEYDLTYKKIE
ncbi:MAG: tetratricopeptide repeat protein [Saprospiraceae bacterium]